MSPAQNRMLPRQISDANSYVEITPFATGRMATPCATLVEDAQGSSTATSWRFLLRHPKTDTNLWFDMGISHVSDTSPLIYASADIPTGLVCLSSLDPGPTQALQTHPFADEHRARHAIPQHRPGFHQTRNYIPRPLGPPAPAPFRLFKLQHDRRRWKQLTLLAGIPKKPGLEIRRPHLGLGIALLPAL